LLRFNYVDDPLLNTGDLVRMIRARLGRTGMQARAPREWSSACIAVIARPAELAIGAESK
jgi:hypothetical protein